VRDHLRELFERLVGAPASVSIAARLTRRRLRVLTYHDVAEPADFRSHLDQLLRWFTPVAGAQVAAAFAGGPALPDSSVWVTFDDGDPSVVRRALPVLAEVGVPATLFVCPAFVVSGCPPWWETVAAAVEHGRRPARWSGPWVFPDAVSALKAVPDAERRAVVDDLAGQLRAAGLSSWGPGSLTVDDLRRWIDAGGEVGNHTWDHPCLDETDPADQRRQIVDAHDWLVEHDVLGTRLFAYPNGDWTPESEAVLAELGYDLALLHDHRLASVDQPRYQVSRLRVGPTASAARVRAILSGLHPLAYHQVVTRARGRRAATRQ